MLLTEIKSRASSNKNQSKTLMNLAMEKKKSSKSEPKNENLKNEELAAAKKLKIKQEENQMKESEMWDKLSELNNKFKTIKQTKKDEKKMSASIL